MKSILLTCIALCVKIALPAQDSLQMKNKILELSFGTFNTVTKSNKITVNPALSGSFGDYYFDNRYNYEAENSASLNFGKRIFKKIKHLEIIPMAGFVFGSFKGVTAETQLSYDCSFLTVSTDNQYSIEYRQSGKRLFFNWSTARYKINRFLRFGITTFLDHESNQGTTFDKGLTVALAIKKFAVRLYGFNIENANRYYWIAVRYNFKLKLANN